MTDILEPVPLVEVMAPPVVLSVHDVSPAPGDSAPMPTAEQAQASSQLFAASSDGDVLVGMLGMWTGVMLLRDLAVEHFGAPADEEEADRRKERPDPVPPLA